MQMQAPASVTRQTVQLVFLWARHVGASAQEKPTCQVLLFTPVSAILHLTERHFAAWLLLPSPGGCLSVSVSGLANHLHSTCHWASKSLDCSSWTHIPPEPSRTQHFLVHSKSLSVMFSVTTPVGPHRATKEHIWLGSSMFVASNSKKWLLPQIIFHRGQMMLNVLHLMRNHEDLAKDGENLGIVIPKPLKEKKNFYILHSS